MATRYYLSLPDLAALRNAGALAFRAHGAEGIAEELQAALRDDGLFQRWRAAQHDPDEVDPALGACDSAADVRGEQRDLHIDLVVVTSLPSTVLRHRLRLLAGQAWQLRDVTAA
ncbi:MAG: hypothetical protein E6Q88_03435 [Lysobacteraceae bacterium]|nr:MAG: hypothetical protein E6Q88_03435 [Xanthomonadaceae bacterium]